MNELERLQEELPTLRVIAGLSSQKLADKLGISRTVIYFLENKHRPMTKLYYHAILCALYCESIITANTILSYMIEFLLFDDNTTEEDRAKIREIIGSTKNKTGKKQGTPAIAARVRGPIMKFLEERESHVRQQSS